MGRVRLWTTLWCIQLNDPVRQMIARSLYLMDDGLVAINHRVCFLNLRVQA
jgi:hypothetical protein